MVDEFRSSSEGAANDEFEVSVISNRLNGGSEATTRFSNPGSAADAANGTGITRGRGRRRRSPSAATFHRAALAVILVLICFAMQILVFNQLSTSAYPNIIVFNLVLSMLVVPMLYFISRQPADVYPSLNGETVCFRVPLSPWLPVLAVFVNMNVFFTVLPRAWQEFSLLMSFGETRAIFWCFWGNGKVCSVSRAVREGERGRKKLPKKLVCILLLPSSSKSIKFTQKEIERDSHSRRRRRGTFVRAKSLANKLMKQNVTPATSNS